MTHEDAIFKKSSRSAGVGECVEVAHTPDGVLVRDSKQPNEPVLSFSVAEWEAFVAGAKAGEFDAEVAGS